jgi:CPA2 family monovalent cation:H+ antiporter-2
VRAAELNRREPPNITPAACAVVAPCWVADSPATRQLAEFGVVFLLFTLGLEFSLPRLVQMRGVVFGLGGAQVVLTMAVCAIARPTLQAAVVLAGAPAMSSTAKRPPAQERLETRRCTADTAACCCSRTCRGAAADPVRRRRSRAFRTTRTGLAAAVLAVVLLIGQRLMRPWFTLVARRRSHELFIINVLFITLGLAYLTELAGLSLALGAFVAGMLISGQAGTRSRRTSSPAARCCWAFSSSRWGAARPAGAAALSARADDLRGAGNPVA